MIGTLTFAVMAATTLAATPCEGLKAISLPNTTITTSEFVPEGPAGGGARGGGAPGAPGARGGGAPAGARGQAPAGQPPAGAPAAAAAGNRGGGARGGGGGQAQILPAHCRVVAVLKPSSDSLINMELWL